MLLKVFYKEIHHKRSIFIVLLVFVGFDFVEPQSAGNDTEKYTASELAANHQHATELCTSVGGRLPVIKDRNSIINFKQWLLSYVGEDEDSQCYWLEMKRQTESNNFEWVDGSNFEGFRGEITFEPGFSSSSRDCVCVARESKIFVAKTKECFARTLFICQKRAEFETIDIPMDRQRASQTCTGSLRTLPVLQNRSKVMEFKQWLLSSQTEFKESVCYWLDVKRQYENSRDFTWMDGSTFNGFMGEIDLKDGFFSSKDDCVCAAKQDQIVVAQTMGCSANAYVVCQNRITDLSCTNFTLITILSKTYKENLDDGSDERAGNYLSIFFGLGLAFFILAILTYLFRKFLRKIKQDNDGAIKETPTASYVSELK